MIAIIGGGPAGLMAAEILSAAGLSVTVYERMPTPGRKLLIAGRGGLNLTHSEPFARFVTRYGAASSRLAPILEAFPPSALIAWAEGLGQQNSRRGSGGAASDNGDGGRVVPALSGIGHGWASHRKIPSSSLLTLCRKTKANYLVGAFAGK